MTTLPLVMLVVNSRASQRDCDFRFYVGSKYAVSLVQDFFHPPHGVLGSLDFRLLPFKSAGFNIECTCECEE